MVSLAILSVGSLTRMQSAEAEPAPMFRPILRDIQNQIPKGMVMRLPASIPNNGMKLYPIVPREKSDFLGDDAFVIGLASTPNCDATACNIGNLAVSRRNHSYSSELLQESRQNGEPITLKKGIRGFYFYKRAGSAGYRWEVVWEQNGMVFEVDFRRMSRKQVIDVAISMANESPIRSAR
jgi:hypothetical protein